MKNIQIEQAVEAICTRGCQYVYTVLSDEKSRCECNELHGLEPHQQADVMKELEAVMSVYQQSGGCQV